MLPRFTRPSLAASQAVSFQSHAAYIGLPQLKAYHRLRLYFELRTLEPAGLVMFNGGQVEMEREDVQEKEKKERRGRKRKIKGEEGVGRIRK